MVILVADKFSSSALETIKKLGLEVVYDPELKEQTLVDKLTETQAGLLVVRSTKVNAAMLRASEALQVVVRAGAGVNTIDVGAASKLGIFVTNCPGKNAVAVAELTLGLILALDRRIPDGVAQLRAGKWDKTGFSKARGLKGLTLGLIGFGNIGREVAERAKGFGLKIVCWSRSLSDAVAEQHGIVRLGSPKEVAKVADIVSVHVALSPETKHLCDKGFFEALKPGAFFINTAREEVCDEAALRVAIEKKGVRAGLDVFAGEPSSGNCDWSSPLAQLPQVYGTHHIGASTDQAQEAIGNEALRIIKTFVERGEVLNCVNLDLDTPATHVLCVRHLNRVGVLAAVLGELQKAEINVLDMENRIFEGDEAAIAKIRLSKGPAPDVLKSIRGAHQAVISAALLEAKH